MNIQKAFTAFFLCTQIIWTRWRH